MDNYKLGVMESKFADLIWENEPIKSGELVKLCSKQLDWKKSTTYTMLRRLCDRKIFQNQNGSVSSLITKEHFMSMKGKNFIEENFSGSLPKFLTAFTSRNKLSKKEIEEIKAIIDNYDLQ